MTIHTVVRIVQLGLIAAIRVISIRGDAQAARNESEKPSMIRKVHASFTRFQGRLRPWDHVAEGAYHRLVTG